MSGLTDVKYVIDSGSDDYSHPMTQVYSDCPMVYSCEMYDESGDYWVAVSDPPIADCTSSTGLSIQVDACADSDGGLLDDGNYSCADYTADNGATPLTYTCDGLNDGASGFSAATMCCFCGGGTNY